MKLRQWRELVETGAVKCGEIGIRESISNGRNLDEDTADIKEGRAAWQSLETRGDQRTKQLSHDYQQASTKSSISPSAAPHVHTIPIPSPDHHPHESPRVQSNKIYQIRRGPKISLAWGILLFRDVYRGLYYVPDGLYLLDRGWWVLGPLRL